MKRISQALKPVMMVLAALYFVAEAMFMNIALRMGIWTLASGCHLAAVNRRCSSPDAQFSLQIKSSRVAFGR